MRLDKVRLGEEEPLADILEFYMGENTIDRQIFISRNLRSARELEDVEF
jgi:topoisomerase-4 subunit B